MKPLTFVFFPALAVLLLAATTPCAADVPPPPAPGPLPAGYCTTIYNELNTDLQAFNQLLLTPPSWTLPPGGPPLYAANLQVADANSGPALAGPNYMAGVLAQLQEEQALGVQAIIVGVGFPVLYAPFQGGQAQLAPYLSFYQQVAAAVRNAGMKLIVDQEVLMVNDIEAGWTNLTAYYASLSWAEYMQARATMAATVAETMQPDYLVLAEEPDTEALETGQQNMNTPSYAAQMISGEISAVRTSTYPNVKLGAGFGSWLGPTPPNGLADYAAAYVALPLDYIDFHLLPINSEAQGSLIGNTLTIANLAARANMPVAISQAWLWKMENSEWNVFSADFFRARNPFSFWVPLDTYFLQTLTSYANYTTTLYVAPQGPDYLFDYQTFGGTTQNGGSTNCTCTTTDCDGYNIVHTETQQTSTANQNALFSTTGLAFAAMLVSPADTVPPSTPNGLAATAGYTTATITWAASIDNVGVAGYNIYRCSPPAFGQPCSMAWIANEATLSYTDTTLTPNTPYNYQVQAFDLANNDSAFSQTISLQTYRTSADAPASLTATAVSPKQINLAWSPPQNATGLTQYLVYSGSSMATLQPLVTLPSTKTTYSHQPLSPFTTYYYGVEAVESGITSAMSPAAYATTLALPNPPDSVTAVAQSPTTVALTWQESTAPNSLPIGNYQVWRGTVPGNLAKIASVTSPSLTNRSLAANTQYYYEIVAVDTKNDSSVPSSQIAVTTLPMPLAPTGLSATTPAATQIAFTWHWSPAPNGLPASHYIVNCGLSAGSMSQVGTPTVTSLTWRSAAPGTKYYCNVEAADTADDQSPPSPIISVTTPPMPNAPTGVVAVANSSTRITVTWTETLPPAGLQILSYTILRGPSAGSLSTLATRSTPSFIDTSVTPGNTYVYAIQATDIGHDISSVSAPSAPLATH